MDRFDIANRNSCAKFITHGFWIRYTFLGYLKCFVVVVFLCSHVIYAHKIDKIAYLSYQQATKSAKAANERREKNEKENPLKMERQGENILNGKDANIV